MARTYSELKVFCLANGLLLAPFLDFTGVPNDDLQAEFDGINSLLNHSEQLQKLISFHTRYQKQIPKSIMPQLKETLFLALEEDKRAPRQPARPSQQ